MDWQLLLATIKEQGYSGKDDDLAAVKEFCEKKFGKVRYDGDPVDIVALHTKEYPPKKELDMTAKGKDAEIAKLKEKIAILDTEAELMGRKQAVKDSLGKHVEPTVRVGLDNLTKDPKGGFPTFGHFLIEVKRCPGSGGETGGNFMPPPDSRLGKWNKAYNQIARAEEEEQLKNGIITKATLSTYSAEQTGADGGFAVPPEFRAAIMNRVEALDSIAARCDRAVLSSNSITAAIDVTTPWQTSGGILTYWIGETTAITQSKVALQQRTFTLRKLCSLVPVTEELGQDAAFLGGYITNKAGDKLGFAVDNAILNGNGVTQPTGVVGHAGTVSVAKESNQASTTIVGSNIQKMWMAMPAANRRRAVWIANDDTQYQLQRMFVQGKTDANTNIAAGSLIWLPANTIANQPYETLFGRPLIYHQACATLGTVGDIILFDPMSYLVCTKADGIQTTSSIHLWFDQATNALRFLYRVEGQPWWPTTISALNGSQTYGAFATAATR